MKILDFTATLPGPFATMILADMGADIIRIENPTQPDIINKLEPRNNDKSASYTYLNRNKRIFNLNLKDEEAQNRIYNLINEYDIIIEGFRPGTMSRLNLDYQTLKKKNPSIIYLSLTGYGQSGPRAEEPGHDINFLALSGIASLLENKLPSFQIADISGSFYAVISILGAYIQRKNTGEGQYIDLAIHDTTMTMAPLQFPKQLVGNFNPEIGQEILDGGGYYNFYETSDNEYLAVGALERKFFMQLMSNLDLEFESSNRFQRKEIQNAIKDKISSKPLQYWQDKLVENNLCIEPVLKLDQVIDSEQVQFRELIVELDNGEKQIAHPVKYSEFEPTYASHTIDD